MPMYLISRFIYFYSTKVEKKSHQEGLDASDKFYNLALLFLFIIAILFLLFMVVVVGYAFIGDGDGNLFIT